MKRFFLLCLFATSALATDITTRDGRTYHNIEITHVDSDGIRIMHSTGVARLRFEELPDSLQKTYHYDPAKVAAFRKRFAEARKAEAARAAAAEQDRLHKIQVEQEAERKRATEARRAEQDRIASERRQQKVEEVGHVILSLLFIGLGLLLYFLPSIVGRRKNNALAIFVLNLFLGWTFVGWVVALVWACTKD